MIRKLKRKVIVLAMTAVCVLLILLVTGMNIVNFSAVVAEADTTLELISHNAGRFPEGKNEFPGHFFRPMSPELPYESRYFSVVLTNAGKVVLTDTGKVASVDSGTAAMYAQEAFRSGKDKGFIDHYRYQRTVENAGVRIVFLDCGRKLDSFYIFLQTSIAIALFGIVAVFFVIFFFAERIIQPIAQSYEKQKRFITDAGHELKTPLTIIAANVDVLEMEQQTPNESLEDIRQQTRRLTKLTNDLVVLARMEEFQEHMPAIDFPLSEVVTEVVQPFRKLALAQKKLLTVQIAQSLSLKGNADAISQLVSVLLDNALKYTPEGGEIRMEITRSGKNTVLRVSNQTWEVISRESCAHLFDRFYRTDASRNSETGGHGIGLSVAQAIVTAHGGKIQAACSDTPATFCITAIFP